MILDSLVLLKLYSFSLQTGKSCLIVFGQLNIHIDKFSCQWVLFSLVILNLNKKCIQLNLHRQCQTCVQILIAVFYASNQVLM